MHVSFFPSSNSIVRVSLRFACKSERQTDTDTHTHTHTERERERERENRHEVISALHEKIVRGFRDRERRGGREGGRETHKVAVQRRL